MCLNARSIVNKKNELIIMVEDTDPHIIGNQSACYSNLALLSIFSYLYSYFDGSFACKFFI